MLPRGSRELEASCISSCGQRPGPRIARKRPRVRISTLGPKTADAHLCSCRFYSAVEIRKGTRAARETARWAVSVPVCVPVRGSASGRISTLGPKKYRNPLDFGTFCVYLSLICSAVRNSYGTVFYPFSTHYAMGSLSNLNLPGTCFLTWDRLYLSSASM